MPGLRGGYGELRLSSPSRSQPQATEAATCTAAATRGRARAGEAAQRPRGAGRGRSNAQDAGSRDRPSTRSRHAVPSGARHLQVSQTPDLRVPDFPAAWRFIPRHPTTLRVWWRAIYSPRFTDEETVAP